MKQEESLKMVVWRWVKLLLLLYLFFVAIKLMGHSFKGMGKDHVKDLLTGATANPFAGLLIGVLSTAIIQSSSTTTAMVVGFVSGGVLGIGNAVPVIMGANIGTTVTNSLVSFGHARHKNEFRRAYEVAIVHDVFNVMVVVIMLPLEMTFHFLEKTALAMADLLTGGGGMTFKSPLDMILKPVVKMIDGATVSLFGKVPASIIMLVLAAIFLIIALVMIVKTMKSIVGQKIEGAVDTILTKHGYLAMVLGAGITAVIQSSSLTTSLLVPMAGAGLITIRAAFPVTLGANLGTTITALLAALAGGPLGLAIALVHLLFNISGTLIFYPIPFMREIPIRASIGLTRLTDGKWYRAAALSVAIFFVIPLLGMWLFT